MGKLYTRFQFDSCNTFWVIMQKWCLWTDRQMDRQRHNIICPILRWAHKNNTNHWWNTNTVCHVYVFIGIVCSPYENPALHWKSMVSEVFVEWIDYICLHMLICICVYICAFIFMSKIYLELKTWMIQKFKLSKIFTSVAYSSFNSIDFDDVTMARYFYCSWEVISQWFRQYPYIGLVS